MFEGKFIIASGPVILKEGKILLNHDEKDDFWKIPGGTIEEGIENLEEACKREVKEEINGEIEIIRPLNPVMIWKNPQTKERMAITLIHYLAKLLNEEEIKPCGEIKKVKWISISEIKARKYKVAPNIEFLIEKGDIK
ncbi:NUDIX domain protein [uncultured archaeon]|nr:NUDIX domain protein [uncultured archaeon]